MNFDFNQLDDAEKALVLPLLPVRINEIADCIGLPSAMVLVAALGGCEIRFTKDPACGSFQRLASVVGELAARQLGEQFAVEEIAYIPRCQAAFTALRAKRVTEDFDTLLRASCSTRTAANELAIRYGMSYRAVEKIVNGGCRARSGTPTKAPA